MMKSYPSLVTIVIPCFNQGAYIDECLESVFTQMCTLSNSKDIFRTDNELL